jgi:hypothetical protein
MPSPELGGDQIVKPEHQSAFWGEINFGNGHWRKRTVWRRQPVFMVEQVVQNAPSEIFH